MKNAQLVQERREHSVHHEQLIMQYRTKLVNELAMLDFSRYRNIHCRYCAYSALLSEQVVTLQMTTPIVMAVPGDTINNLP